MKIFQFLLFLILFNDLNCQINENNEINNIFPNYYRCYDHGEAYSAAFLITTKYLIQHKRINHNLTM